MKTMLRILLISLVFVFAGCATLPKPSEMQADVSGFTLPKLPEKGKAMVYVVRPSSIGFVVRFNVFIDNKEASSEIGYTRGGQYIYFDLEPGNHHILSKAENWADLDVNVNEGEIVFLKQEPQVGIIMARNGLFKIEDYEGKYHLKRLKLGTIIKDRSVIGKLE